MYKIFDESPSRRANYEQITSASSSDYPLKFCSHRLIENVNVAERTQIIWPKIVDVVNFWKDLPKSKQLGKEKPGQNTSFDCLATSLNTFLINYQTDNPMVSFMAEALDNVLQNLCTVTFL